MELGRIDGARFEEGRAGMRYRDLVPSRLGGRVIASHIRVPGTGPVPDWVHYHRVAFQMIFCRRGWVRVVYEDQGPPFVLEPGDCVLQPPTIRHRVLESSELEVVEVTSPSAHETVADETLALPTAAARPERRFGGQRFVRHRATEAAWSPWRADGFEARDLGLRAATEGLADARVVRAIAGAALELAGAGIRLVYVLDGALAIGDARLGADGCAAVADGEPLSLRAPEACELLVVELDA